MKRIFALLATLMIAACAQAGDPLATAPPSSGTTTSSSELPAPVQALASSQGVSIDGSLDAPKGFHGYIAKFRGQAFPVYLLPDGKHVVIGSLFDAQGKDLTTPLMRAATTPVLGEKQWKQLEQATWIAEGAKDPQRIVYEFTDTECPYCHKLWEDTQPLLESGKVQVRHIIVAVISPRSLPRAGAILAAKDPAAALKQHEQAFGHSPFPSTGEVPDDVRTRIAANNELMRELGIMGTPGIVYKDSEGKVRLRFGVPDPQTVQTIFGN